MKFGFEDLEVWHLALELMDEVYKGEIAVELIGIYQRFEQTK